MHNIRLVNFEFKYLIDNITINLGSFRNFANMKDILTKCNPMMNLSKFTSNKKILGAVVVIKYN